MWNKEINGLETLADVVNPIVDIKMVSVTYWDHNAEKERTVVGTFWETPWSWDRGVYLFMASTETGQRGIELSPYYILSIEE